MQLDGDERLGLLVYLFRATRVVTRQRPTDEHRIQVRYGSETSWHTQEHDLGFDIAGVDVTAVLGVHRDADVLIALDPARYDPLPMGISIEFKDAAVNAALRDGWHVWQRDTIPGVQREARTTEGFDTVIALRPDRLIDLLRFEREATALCLDPALATAPPSRSGRDRTASARRRRDTGSSATSSCPATRSSTSSAAEDGLRSLCAAAWRSTTSGAGSPRTPPSAG